MIYSSRCSAYQMDLFEEAIPSRIECSLLGITALPVAWAESRGALAETTESEFRGAPRAPFPVTDSEHGLGVTPHQLEGCFTV